MSERLFVQQLEFMARVGILPEERRVPQPIGVDIELEYPPQAFTAAVAQDRIEDAVDYARVSQRIVETGTKRDFDLVETLAERIGEMVFSEFPVSSMRLWVRKLVPPLKEVKGSVGVRIERTRRDQSPEPKAAPFLMDVVSRLRKGSVLDVAAGHGRNALYLAGLGGYAVEAVDRDEAALAKLAATAHEQKTSLATRVMELEDESRPPDLGKERYDVILVFFYLHRPLFPALRQALKPGGMLVYETFQIENHVRYQHPRRKEFCLAPNELLRLTTGLRVLHYDEGPHVGGHAHSDEPVSYTARLLAQKDADGPT